MIERIELTEDDIEVEESGAIDLGFFLHIYKSMYSGEELKAQILQDQEKAKRLDEEYEKVCKALIDRDPQKSATPLILFKIMVEKIIKIK